MNLDICITGTGEKEVKYKNMAKRKVVLWVSHSLKCVSFHPDIQFESVNFPEASAMWKMVHQLVNQGYVVQ